MAKVSGLGWTTFSIDDGTGAASVMINDILSAEFATPRGVFDVTGLDKSAYERILGLADFTGQATGQFNATLSHLALRTVSSTSVNREVSITVAGQSISPECLVTDYALSRAADGNLTWTAPWVLADGAVPTWA